MIKSTDNETSSISKRAIYVKDDDFMQCMDIYEDPNSCRVFAIVHENKIEVLFESIDHRQKVSNKLERISMIDICSRFDEQYKDVFLTCSFGPIHTSKGTELALAFAGEIGFVYVISFTETLKDSLKILKGHFCCVMQLEFLKRSKNRLLSCSQDHSIILWDIEKGEVIHRFIDIQNQMSCINCFVI
jgi:WD40 repeat protein